MRKSINILLAVVALTVIGCASGDEVDTKNANTLNWSEYMGELNWNQASAKCKTSGMRLPTIKELKLAFDDGTMKKWQEGSYWSSEKTDEKGPALGPLKPEEFWVRMFPHHGSFSNGISQKSGIEHNVRCIK